MKKYFLSPRGQMQKPQETAVDLEILLRAGVQWEKDEFEIATSMSGNAIIKLLTEGNFSYSSLIAGCRDCDGTGHTMQEVVESLGRQDEWRTNELLPCPNCGGKRGWIIA